MQVGFKMRNKHLFLFFLACYFIIHLTSLAIFPLPWFDEVFFASMTDNFINDTRFFPEVSWFAFEKNEGVTYGPIYFILNSFFVQLFGWNAFSLRLLNFLCGIFSIIISFKLLKKEQISWLLIFVFLLDPFFNIGLHEGRMDLVALFFALTSIYYLQKHSINILYVGLSSVFISLAILTTPRIAIILVPSVFLGLSYLKQSSQKLLFLSLWILPIIILYGSWIFYAFGSLEHYFIYYKTLNQGNATAVHGYLGGNFYIPKHEYLLIFCTLLLYIFVIFNYKKEKISWLFFYSISSILLFYFLVVDWGSYSTIIIPFYYLLLSKKIENPFVQQIQKYVLWLLLAFNLSFFTIKTAYIYSDYQQRSSDKIANFIEKNIPKNSKVIGEATYYYACKKQHIDYRLFDKYLSLEEREEKLRIDFKYEYFIVSNLAQKRAKSEIDYFLSKGKFEKTATYQTQNNWLNKLILKSKVVSIMEQEGYSCVIYKRIIPQL